MNLNGVYTAHTDENSLEHVLVSEVYPKKQMVQDQPGIQVPFPLLYGESVEYLGRTSDGIIALSNYRLYIEYFVNIPVGHIESVEYRDIFHLHIFSKDARTIRCKFLTNDVCLEWYKRILSAIQPLKKLQDAFAFAYFAWYIDAYQRQELQLDGNAPFIILKGDEGHLYTFGKEVERLSFDLKKSWRITLLNEKFTICQSYPKFHLVPISVTDKDIESIANFRSSRRFPSIIWRDARSGVVLARSSQPELGWLGWRNTQDENFLQSVALSVANNPGTVAVTQKMNNGDVVCQTIDKSTTQQNGIMSNGVGGGSNSKNVLIIDARSYAAAVANRAKGGGCECSDYYQNCEIMFMGLANIHAIRKSFLALRSLCAMSSEQPAWLTNIENTKWLLHISGLLKSSVVVANALDKEHRSVLVHCSDGWDRTPQLTALAELMLDPYYRTMEGFRVLVEKEWLEFGHKFADRCGQGLPMEDVNERCPVFLQWLDCVHQLIYQFPCAFEFNEAYLIKLVQHTYSSLFGDFICNTEKERQCERVYHQTFSVWKMLSMTNNRFVNLLYRSPSERERVLRPSCQVQSLRLWSSVYLYEMSPFVTSTEELIEVAESETSSSAEVSPDQEMPAKTRSCEDLCKELDEEELHMNPLPRRLSDPNLARDFLPLETSETVGPISSLVQDKAKKIKIMKKNDEVNKCASNETLKAHDEDEHFVVKNVEPVSLKNRHCLIVNGDAEENVCDIMSNKNVGQSDDLCAIRNGEKEGRKEEEIEIGLLPTPSSFEDSSETLIGDLTDVNQHLIDVNQLEGVSLSSKSLFIYKNSFGVLPSDKNCRNLFEIESSANCIASNGLYAKNMVERCSSMTDLDSWHKHQSDQRKCNAFAQPDGTALTLQQFVSSERSKLPNAGREEALTVDISSPLPLSTVAAAADADACQYSSVIRDSEMNGSLTPSGCSSTPPTPNSESKLSSWRQCSSRLSRHHLDSDGLTSYSDAVQQRVYQMKLEHEQQIRQLERQLNQMKMHMMRFIKEQNNEGVQWMMMTDVNKDEAASRDSSEQVSMGGAHAITSDLSWEQIEEKDAQMTLWVPDHVVTHCTGCEQEFWVARRKHHCRSCGHVFCDECSKYSTPVPQQHFNNPVRVCKRCFCTSSAYTLATTTTTTTATTTTDSNEIVTDRLMPMRMSYL